ncbi:unnamed protein product [Lota lota]
MTTRDYRALAKEADQFFSATQQHCTAVLYPAHVNPIAGRGDSGCHRCRSSKSTAAHRPVLSPRTVWPRS